MRDDPVYELVKDWPTAATISTIDKDAANYNPRQPDTENGKSVSTLVGFYSGTADSGDDFKATLVILPEARPEHLKAKASRCRIGETEYSVHEVRERRWEGRLNGWTLELI